jgi:hypothetical protein
MTTITIETGTEGPRHDPYGWEEITVERSNGDCVTLHQGLVEWVQVNNSQQHGYQIERCEKVFEFFAGCTSAIARKAHARYRSRCRKCGGREFHDQAGYPGESFLLCNNCGSVVDYDFNIQAVI